MPFEWFFERKADMSLSSKCFIQGCMYGLKMINETKLAYL